MFRTYILLAIPVVLLLLAFIFLYLIGLGIFELIKYLKKDSDLQREKKEKEIEFLQAQIDALREGKDT